MTSQQGAVRKVAFAGIVILVHYVIAGPLGRRALGIVPGSMRIRARSR